MGLLFLVLMVAACVAGHGGHEHEHDEVERVREYRDAESIPVHDNRAHRATLSKKSVPSTSESGGWLASLEWLVEWLLIGAITALVLYILQMLVLGGPSRPVRSAVLPKRKPAHVFLTPQELARYNGADPKLPVYVAVRGAIYDVSPRRDMYGVPGQGYNVLAGRDASRALAKHALDEATCANSNIDDLTPGEIEALDQWESSFKQKYNVAGYVVRSEEEKVRRTAEETKRYDAETARLAPTGPAAASAAAPSKL